jgi:hypothetical protein
VFTAHHCRGEEGIKYFFVNSADFLAMISSLERSPTGIGAPLAVATIPLHLLLRKPQSEQFAAVLLAVIGAIYIGFGLQKWSRFQIATELAVASVFVAAALAAIWSTPWIIKFVYLWGAWKRL